MLRVLIEKILSMFGKSPPEEREYYFTSCIGFWIDSNENDEYDDEGY